MMDFNRESNNRRIQMDDQAGHTKLTAVSIFIHGAHKTFYVMLRHNARGEAFLPQNMLEKLLLQAGRTSSQTRYGVR
jgi:hypothetical protein